MKKATGHMRGGVIACLVLLLTCVLMAGAVSAEGGATTAEVSNYQDLVSNLSNVNVISITLTESFTAEAQITITRDVTIDGGYHTISAKSEWSSVPGKKQLMAVIGDYAVTLKNISLDSLGYASGLQAYKTEKLVTLENVYLNGSKGNGLTVNSANVTASNLTIENSGWKQSVDVGYGDTTLAPVFQMTDDGHLNDLFQINSDKKDKGFGTVDVPVTYTQYSANYNNTTFVYGNHKIWWSNQQDFVTNIPTFVNVTITNTTSPVHSLHQSFKEAVNVASGGDVLSIQPGTYDVTNFGKLSDADTNLYINKALTLKAADPDNKPVFTSDIAGNILRQSVICIDSSDVTLNGLVITPKGTTRNKAVEVCFESNPAGPISDKTIQNVVIRNCVIGDSSADKASVYIGQSNVGSYTIENNQLKEMLVISNGAGNAMKPGDSAVVRGNTIDKGIRISGTRDTGWDAFNIENLPLITGNTIGPYTDSDAGYDVFISSCSQDKSKIIPVDTLRSIFRQNTFLGNAKIVDYAFISEKNVVPYASNYTSIVKGNFDTLLTGPSSLSPNVEAIYSAATNAADTGLTYVWKVDGVTISGYTGDSVKYIFTNSDTTSEKTYTLSVTATAGSQSNTASSTITVSKAKPAANDVPAAPPVVPTTTGFTEKGTAKEIVFAASDVSAGQTATVSVMVLDSSHDKYGTYKDSIPAAAAIPLVIEVTATNLVKSDDLDAMAIMTLEVPSVIGASLESYKVYHKKSNNQIEPLAFVSGYPKLEGSKVTLKVLIGGFSDVIIATVNVPKPDPVSSSSSSSSGNTEDAFRVLFDAKGGSFVQPATGLSYGDRITKPADPERSGYSFVGWYKDEAGTIAWVFSEDAVPGDISLYAKWVPAGSAVTATERPTEKVTASATSPATVKQTASATQVSTASATTAPAGISPTMTQAPAPLAGLLLGLFAAGVLIRRRE